MIFQKSSTDGLGAFGPVGSEWFLIKIVSSALPNSHKQGKYTGTLLVDYIIYVYYLDRREQIIF